MVEALALALGAVRRVVRASACPASSKQRPLGIPFALRVVADRPVVAHALSFFLVCALLESFALALGGTLAREVAITLAVVALTSSLTERVDVLLPCTWSRPCRWVCTCVLLPLLLIEGLRDLINLHGFVSSSDVVGELQHDPLQLLVPRVPSVVHRRVLARHGVEYPHQHRLGVVVTDQLPRQFLDHLHSPLELRDE